MDFTLPSLLPAKVKLKVKLSPCLINKAPRHEDKWGSGGIASSFLTSTLDGRELLASRPGCFSPGRRAPRTHWTGGSVVSSACLELCSKTKSLFPCLETNPGRALVSSVYHLSYPGSCHLLLLVL
jgi:hypothetical protein